MEANVALSRAMRQEAETITADKAVEWDLATMEIDEKHAHDSGGA
jgi:hypothetical protein